MKTAFIMLVLFTGIFGFFKKDFKIIEATRQEWTGGLRESGKGINYKITLEAKKNSDKLKFEDIWIKERTYKYKIYNISENKPGNVFKKNDTLIISATIKTHKDDNSLKEEQLPFDYTNESVIGYKLKNKKKYKPVGDIRILKPSYYK